MTFTESIRTNIAECLNFKDRAPRSAYWWYVLFVTLVSFVTIILDVMLFWPAMDMLPLFLVDNFGSLSDFYVNVIPVTTFWYLLNFLPMLAVGVRRMHDCDRPGWWYVLAVVFVMVMSVVVFAVVGPQSVEMMSIAFNPEATVAQLEAVLADSQEMNRVSNILSGIQTLGSILIIIWMATKGTDGPNQYGEDPLA